MTASPPGELSLFEHLYLWLRRHAPGYLDDLQSAAPRRSPKTALASYLSGSHGDQTWFGADFRRVTGRYLPGETLSHVRRWIADLCDGPEEVRWIGRDPAAGWQPVTPDQLRRMVPEDHLEDSELTNALSTLLHAIHAGVLDFAGERHRVRVFTRQAQLPDDPGEMPQSQAPEPEKTGPVAAGLPATAKPSGSGPKSGTINYKQRAREALARGRLRELREPDERPGATVDRLAAEPGFKWPGDGTPEYERRMLVEAFKRELDATKDK